MYIAAVHCHGGRAKKAFRALSSVGTLLQMRPRIASDSFDSDGTALTTTLTACTDTASTTTLTAATLTAATLEPV